MLKKLLFLMIMSIALAACGSEATPPLTSQAPVVEEATLAEPDAAVVAEATPTEEVAPVPDDTPLPVEPTVTPAPEAETQSSAETSEPAADNPEASAASEPIEVTYFTPAQGEGPYYTVEKPADRDNDLTVLAGAGGTPAGQIIEFSGKVYNANGLPLSGVTVEIWQTDNNGIYLHPGDPSTANRDPDFQFYGESVSDEAGSYSFRTIVPGQYEPRPQHIHLKVKNGEEELLTSQIYFEGDPSLESDGLFQGAGDANEHLVMTVSEGQDANGNPILVGEHDLILNSSLTTTIAEPVAAEAEEEVVAAVAENSKLNLNQAEGADFQAAIPNFGDRMVREFLEYRPYISIQQFRREIGKYVDEAQVAEYEQYVYVPVSVDDSDAATLQQIPGVDEAIAAELMARRPFGSNEAFLANLAEFVSEAEVAVASGYLVSQ